MTTETLPRPHTAYDPALYTLALLSLEIATAVDDEQPHPVRIAEEYGELPYGTAAQALHQRGEVWA